MSQLPALLSRRLRRAAALLLLGFLASSATAFVLIAVVWCRTVVAWLTPPPPPPPKGLLVACDCPAISQPATVSAAAAPVGDDEPVLGISADGFSRAYVVRTLARDPGSHIVNDLLGDVPVTVTHCGVSH